MEQGDGARATERAAQVPEVREPEFKARLLALTDATLALIRREIANGREFDDYTDWDFVGGSITLVTVPHWSRAVVAIWEQIKELPEYGRVIEYASGSAQIATFLQAEGVADRSSPGSVLFATDWRILQPFLRRAARLNQPGDPRPIDAFDFDVQYAALERDIYRDPVVLRIIAPLARFELRGIAKIELSPTLRIRTADRSDQRRYLRALEEPSMRFGGWQAGKIKYVVEIDIETARLPRNTISRHGLGGGLAQVDAMYDEAVLHLDRVVAALRLFRPAGFAMLELMYYWRDPWNDQPARLREHEVWKARDGTVLVLSEPDADQFRQFWGWLDARMLRASPWIRIAIRRFSRAAGDAPMEDRLIDACVAFDALFTLGERQELTYKVQQRVAFLLGDGAEERRKIAQILRDTYTTRGSLIHGSKEADAVSGTTFWSIYAGRAFVSRAVDLLRRAILASLALPPSLPVDGLNEDLRRPD